VAFKIPKSFLRALAEAKKYTPADPKIREMMLKAGLGIDLKNPENSALPGMGTMNRYKPPGWGQGSIQASGKQLERFGPTKPNRPPHKIRGRTMEQALAENKAFRERPRIPTGLTAQRKAKQAQEKSRHRS
jgi:hypothetical protein